MTCIIKHSLLVGVFCSFSCGQIGCRSKGLDQADKTSGMAMVEIEMPSGENFDALELSLIPDSPEGTELRGRNYSSSDAPVNESVEPGDYRVVLAFYQSGELMFSSEFCSGIDSNSYVTFIVGSNNLNVTVCEADDGDRVISVGPGDDDSGGSSDSSGSSGSSGSSDSSSSSDENAAGDDENSDISVSPKVVKK